MKKTSGKRKSLKFRGVLKKKWVDQKKNGKAF